MKAFLFLLIIVPPIIMFLLRGLRPVFLFIFNIGAITAAIIFGTIASYSIYEIIKDNTVFMTSIHAIFLDPFFLLTGGYLGIYTIYRLILLTIGNK